MDHASFFPKSLKDFLLKFWAGYNKVNEVIASILVAVIAIIIFMGVCARYVFRMPFEWSDEFAIYGFIWLSFLGAALAEKSDKHFRVTILVDKLGPKARLVIDIFLHIILFVILYRFFFDSMKYFQQGKSGISTIMQIPLSYIYVSMPVCVAMIFLNRIKVFIDNIIKYVRMIKEPNYIPPAEVRQEAL